MHMLRSLVLTLAVGFAADSAHAAQIITCKGDSGSGQEEVVLELNADGTVRSDDKYDWVLNPPMGLKNATYSIGLLREVGHGSTSVLKIPRKVIGKSVDSFKAKYESRDYDYDYSGVFYWIHGYVVRNKMKMSCSSELK